MDVKTLGMSELSDCVIALRSQTDRVIALGQINVTAQFYLENNRKIHPPGVRTCRSKDAKRRRAPALWLLFLYVISSPGACPM